MSGISSSDGFLTMYFVVLAISLVASFILAIIPSKIAKRKGYSGAGFYWFGVAALIPAIIVASVLRDKNAAPAQPQAPEPQFYQPAQAVQPEQGTESAAGTGNPETDGNGNGGN